MALGRFNRRAAWAGYAVLALAAGAMYLAVPSGSLRDGLSLAVGYSAAAAVVAGVALNRPRAPIAWYLFAAGIALLTTGDALWYAEESWREGGDAAFSAADAARFAGYATLVAATVLFVRAQTGDARRTREVLADAFAVAAAGLVLGWTFLVDPLLDGTAVTTGERATTFANLLLDLVLVAILVQLVLRPGGRLLAHELVTAGLALLLTGDILRHRELLLGSYDGGAWFEALFPIGSALWATAALHPSMRRMVEPGGGGGATLTRVRLWVLALLTTAVPVALAFEGLELDEVADLVVIAIAAAILPLLVVARLAMALADVERMAGAARSAEHRVRTVVEASPLPIALLDRDRRVEVWNRAAERATGWSEHELIGKPQPIAPTDETALLRAGAQLARDEEARVEVTAPIQDGTLRDWDLAIAPVPDHGDQDAGFVAVAVDVTERNRQEERIRYVASHDALTELPNRRSFEDFLAQAVKRARRGPTLGLLLVDIDNFKLVNDTAGHPVGDRFLIGMTGVLRASLRPGDFLARLGGDEFAAIVEDVSEQQLKDVAERMLERARAFRFVEGGQVFDLGLSIGLCVIDGTLKPPEAMTVADSALYAAKEQGKNRAVLWGAAKADRSELMIANNWVARIRQAIRDDKLVLALQPVVDLETREPLHYEALVRMQGAHGELVPPSAFLPAAARFGLMSEVDRWVIDHAIGLLRADAGLRLFANLAGSSLADDALFEWIERELRTSSLEPGRLGFEITEKAAVRDMDEAARRMTELRALGCPLALDDFGVDFASFEPLRQLPVDFVKIGDTFVRDLLDDSADRAIVKAIATVSHALSRKVIVEGVESEAAADIARSFGVEYGQGFAFGPPDSTLFLELERGHASPILASQAS